MPECAYTHVCCHILSERVSVFMLQSIFFFSWFGCSHQQDIIVKSFPGSFLLAPSCWLDYCNRDCSPPRQSFRWWLGGETLSPFLRDSMGLLVASVIQDFQDCSTYSLQWQSLGQESSLNDVSTHCGLLSLDVLKLCLTSTSGQGEDQLNVGYWGGVLHLGSFMRHFCFSLDIYGSFLTEACTSWMIWKINCRLPSQLLGSLPLGGSLAAAQVSKSGQMNFRPCVKAKPTACLCLVRIWLSGAITNRTPSP